MSSASCLVQHYEKIKQVKLFLKFNFVNQQNDFIPSVEIMDNLSFLITKTKPEDPKYTWQQVEPFTGGGGSARKKRKEVKFGQT